MPILDTPTITEIGKNNPHLKYGKIPKRFSLSFAFPVSLSSTNYAVINTQFSKATITGTKDFGFFSTNNLWNLKASSQTTWLFFVSAPNVYIYGTPGFYLFGVLPFEDKITATTLVSYSLKGSYQSKTYTFRIYCKRTIPNLMPNNDKEINCSLWKDNLQDLENDKRLYSLFIPQDLLNVTLYLTGTNATDNYGITHTPNESGTGNLHQAFLAAVTSLKTISGTLSVTLSAA